MSTAIATEITKASLSRHLQVTKLTVTHTQQAISNSGSLTTVEQDEGQDIGGTLILLQELLELVKKDFEMECIETAISSLQTILDDGTYDEGSSAIIRRYLVKAFLIRYGLCQWVGDLDACSQQLGELGERNLVKFSSQSNDYSTIAEVQVAAQLLQAARNSLNVDLLSTMICMAEVALQGNNHDVNFQNAELLLALGNAYVMRYLYYSGVVDLDEAAAIFQEAGQISTGSIPLKCVAMTSLEHIGWLQLMECGEIMGLHDATNYMVIGGRLDEEGRNFFGIGQKIIATGEAQLEEGITLLTSSLNHRPGPHPRRLFSLQSLGHALFTRFKQLSSLRDLEESMVIQRQALELTPIFHPERPTSLNNLACTLVLRFKHTGASQDLEECIRLHKEALDLLPASHSNRHSSLFNLAGALFDRYQQSERLQDLDECVMLYRDALGLIPLTHPNRSSSLGDLACALYTLFNLTGAPQDLEECIVLYREALELAPASHPNHLFLNNLAKAIFSRFQQKGAFQDLEESTALFRAAFDIIAPTHPDHCLALNSLAGALLERFKRTAALHELEECIRLNRKALDLVLAPHPNRASSLDSLANALTVRFEQRGEQQDLEECIRLRREALDLRPAAHPSKSLTLNNLAYGLLNRFLQKGETQDLEECITLCREAVGILPATNQNRHFALCNLAHALSARFMHKGTFQDLDECIMLLRETLGRDPVSTWRSNRPRILSNLATALIDRFEHRGAFEDLEEGILLHRESHSLSMDDADRSLSLNNLGGAIYVRFRTKRVFHDLEECILIYRKALALLPAPHPHRSLLLANLAGALGAHFEHQGFWQHLDESIIFTREALELLPASHIKRSMLLNNLGHTLLERFNHKKTFEDLEESIVLLKEALNLRPAPHPDRSSTMDNLAHALSIRFENKNMLKDYDLGTNVPPSVNASDVAQIGVSLQDSPIDCSDIKTALCYYREASRYETGSLIGRLHSSQFWADCARKHLPTLTLDAYICAMDLLPQLVAVDLTLRQRLDVLEHTRELVGDAAKSAIDANQFDLAVIFLSTGRSLFWSQALGLRSPVDELMVTHPSLGEKLKAISQQIEYESHTGSSPTSIPVVFTELGSNAETYHGLCALASQRSQIIEEIRKIPAYEQFLLPPSFASLQSAARSGPIILLNASQFGCDALILHPTDPVKRVPLSDIRLQELDRVKILIQIGSGARPAEIILDRITNNANALQALLARDFILESALTSIHDSFQLALGWLWLKIVKPLLEILCIEKTSFPKRLWWCPTGLFTSLPFHAAGIYSSDNEPVDCLFQYAVSSYCNAPQDLLHPTSEVALDFKLTAIIEPEAPGAVDLPGTRLELKKIEKHVPNKQHLITRIGSKNAPNQIDELLSDIQKSSFVHFGCHGMQNLQNSLESHLLLSGGKLTMSNIIRECRVPEGALAYLSACETAKGDEIRPDESLNLVATMMFAGFRGAVGTMWSILDDDAPVVADVFYRHLFRNREETPPDIRDAAYGLHLATKELRERRKSLNSWVPYVHYGI